MARTQSAPHLRSPGTVPESGVFTRQGRRRGVDRGANAGVLPQQLWDASRREVKVPTAGPIDLTGQSRFCSAWAGGHCADLPQLTIARTSARRRRAAVRLQTIQTSPWSRPCMQTAARLVSAQQTAAACGARTHVRA